MIDKSNRISRKYYNRKVEGGLEGNFNPKYSGEAINDKAKTSE